jgi:hypothetical protein
MAAKRTETRATVQLPLSTVKRIDLRHQLSRRSQGMAS